MVKNLEVFSFVVEVVVETARHMIPFSQEIVEVVVVVVVVVEEEEF